MSERINVRQVEGMLAWLPGLYRVRPDAGKAMLRVVRAAARVNELVGTETEDGQAEAWTELDAALAAFDFGPTAPSA